MNKDLISQLNIPQKFSPNYRYNNENSQLGSTSSKNEFIKLPSNISDDKSKNKMGSKMNIFSEEIEGIKKNITELSKFS